MLRYVACTWDAPDTTQHPIAARVTHALMSMHGWRTVFADSGLRVFCAGENSRHGEAHALADHAGVVVGTLFRRPDDQTDYSPRPAVLDRDATAKIVATQGRELIDSYWGSYVAVLRQPGGVAWVIRSPLGDLPCFTAPFRGGRLFFSDVADCASLGAIAFSTNWKYVARYLVKFTFGSDETGLNEVSEVRGGNCAKVHSGTIQRKVYWDPRRISNTDRIIDLDTAQRLVRSAAISCVSAWASRHERILLMLSGGLDSSIVTSCLKHSSTQVTCINQYSAGASSDEREFARAAAQDAGFRMIELERNPSLDLREALRANVSETPQRYLGRIEFASIERELASSTGSTALFTGNRGDEIFLRNPRFAAADYLSRHGVDSSFYRILLHKAEREGISLWRAALHAFRYGLLIKEWDLLKEWGSLHTLIAGDLIDTIRSAPPAQSAEIGEPLATPMGKQYQILGLQEPEQLYLPLARPGDPLPVAPLMSQPLVEVCLRIPTYVLAHGGWDRAVARQAFAGEVPAKILQRRSKGSITESANRIFEDNLPFMRELLLDGQLVQHGLLDRKKLAEALGDGPTRLLKNNVHTLRYLNAEIWLTLWNRTRQAAIAA